MSKTSSKANSSPAAVTNAAANDEVEFKLLGNRLAANDKETRDKTVKALVKYLAKKPDLSELDMMKIWKGLYYSYWMSDKPKVQEELAMQIAEMCAVFHDAERTQMFYDCFFLTMQREWGGIDKYRLDKYYSLIRKMQHQSFLFLKESGYDSQVIKTYLDHLKNHVLLKKPDGIRYHMADLYITELSKSIGDDASSEVLHMLVDFWLQLLVEVDSKPCAQAFATRCIEPLATDFVTMTTVDREDMEVEGEGEGEGEETRLSLHGIDLRIIKARLFELASSADIDDSRRDLLYSLHETFKRAVKKAFPEESGSKRKREDVLEVKEVKEVKEGGKKNKGEKTVPVVDSAEADEQPKKKKKKAESGGSASSTKAVAAPVVEVESPVVPADVKGNSGTEKARETLFEISGVDLYDVKEKKLRKMVEAAGLDHSGSKSELIDLVLSTREALRKQAAAAVTVSKGDSSVSSGKSAKKKGKDTVVVSQNDISTEDETPFHTPTKNNENSTVGNGVKGLKKPSASTPLAEKSVMSTPLSKSNQQEVTPSKSTVKKNVKIVLENNKGIDYDKSIKLLRETPRKQSRLIEEPSKHILKPTMDITMKRAATPSGKKSEGERKEGKKRRHSTAASDFF